MKQEMESLTSPDSMDKWTRNQRLYENLKMAGYCVEPVYDDGDAKGYAKGIEYLRVSVSYPFSQHDHG